MPCAQTSHTAGVIGVLALYRRVLWCRNLRGAGSSPAAQHSSRGAQGGVDRPLDPVNGKQALFAPAATSRGWKHAQSKNEEHGMSRVSEPIPLLKKAGHSTWDCTKLQMHAHT
eukprot:gene14940-biopygen660